jgi:tyrosine-protein kinase Etk/Wzc
VKNKKDFIQEDTIDFKGILLKFFSRWYLFLIALILSYFYAKVYIKYQEPIYRVSATLLVKDESNSLRSVGGLDMFNENKNLHNEMGLIRSLDMVLQTIDSLHFDVSYFWIGKVRRTEFYKDSPFRVVLDTSSFQLTNVPFYITILPDKKFRLQAEINGAPVYDTKTNTVVSQSGKISINETMVSGQTYKNENISFTIYLDNPYFLQEDTKLYFEINDKNVLTHSYKNRLAVYPPNKESSILELVISGPLLKKDIDFINKLSSVYISSGLEEKNKITNNTINFIDGQLELISTYLRDIETELESFKTKNKIKGFENKEEMEYTKLGELEKEKEMIVFNLKYYNYILDYIKSNRDINDIVAPSAIGILDPVLNPLISQLIQLRSEYTVASRNSTDKNPYSKNLQEKIKNTTEVLIENLNNIIVGSNLTLKNYNDRINRLEKDLNILPKKERMLLNLQRKFNLNDHLYNFLLERRAEAGITKASNKADNRILDKASLLNSVQVEPKTDLIFTSLFMLGLIIPFLSIIIYDFLNDKIQTREELEKFTNIPILGTIGHSNKDHNIAVSNNAKSHLSEMFRSIRINLQYLAINKTKKVIGVTSSVSGEGKTFCSINLAVIIALSGKKTLLLGTDLRKPKIFDDFDISNEIGLSSYLSNQNTLAEVIHKTEIPNLDIIPGGPIPPNPSELLSDIKTGILFDKLKETYDFVIVDSAPMGLVSDYLILQEYIDVHIYVVRHNYTKKKQLSKIKDLYNSGNISNVNILINDIKGLVGGYYYGYNDGDSSGYYGNEKRSIWQSVKKNPLIVLSSMFEKTHSKSIKSKNGHPGK